MDNITPSGPETNRAPHAITRRDDGLWFEWAPGESERRVPARALRLACPCAMCVEEMSGRPLLDPANVPDVIGPNGAGKTTLFRMIVGEESADDGEVQVPKRLTIGYFRQDVEEMSGRPLLDPASVPRDIHPVAVQLVGAYALRVTWSDGHSTGIFPWHRLRTLSE